MYTVQMSMMRSDITCSISAYSVDGICQTQSYISDNLIFYGSQTISINKQIALYFTPSISLYLYLLNFIIIY